MNTSTQEMTDNPTTEANHALTSITVTGDPFQSSFFSLNPDIIEDEPPPPTRVPEMVGFRGWGLNE